MKLFKIGSAFCIVLTLCNSSAMAQNSYIEPASPEIKTYESTQFPSRLVYLNGINISSVKNQDLRSVDVHIDESGNIYFTGNQYDVQQDTNYHPLMPSELPKYSRYPKPNSDDLPTQYKKNTSDIDANIQTELSTEKVEKEHVNQPKARTEINADSKPKTPPKTQPDTPAPKPEQQKQEQQKQDMSTQTQASPHKALSSPGGGDMAKDVPPIELPPGINGTTM